MSSSIFVENESSPAFCAGTNLASPDQPIAFWARPGIMMTEDRPCLAVSSNSFYLGMTLNFEILVFALSFPVLFCDYLVSDELNSSVQLMRPYTRRRSAIAHKAQPSATREQEALYGKETRRCVDGVLTSVMRLFIKKTILPRHSRP
ncbi:unnamed protein product [Protopolystoma xenopodis]|uniref:Uncharacterized protein n=1 Tax=Protopolystoma xenopodis TaxID=117903 RepID=A0A3S5B7V3_9PLAT|nr:unnamed protein product [Protopolystoma xenopodis]